MIGDCGLTMQNIGGMIKPEIGYHIRGDCQRKGYAKEAASAVRDWTFQNTPFQEIYSYMKYTNEPSAKTAVSWGCHLVDEFSDEVNELITSLMLQIMPYICTKCNIVTRRHVFAS